MQVVTVGRSEENNIVVSDSRVSRVHLQLVKDDNGGYSVVDLGSTNGTFVNGRRISGEESLNAGDELKIGSTVLPWQSYFAGATVSGLAGGHSDCESGASSNGKDQKPKKKLLYIILIVVVLLVAGGIIFWNIYSGKQEEKAREEQEEQKRIAEESDAAYKDFMKKQAEAADKDKIAAEKQAEADRLARVAAESNSEKDKKAAEEARIAAAEAKKDADKAKIAMDAAEAKVNEYKAKLKDAEAKLKKAEEKEQKANEEIAKANEKAENAAAELEKLKAQSERKDNFTNLLNQMTDPQVVEVCNKMNYNNNKNRDKLTKKFKNANEAEQEIIISTMMQVLEESKTNEAKPQESSDSGQEGSNASSTQNDPASSQGTTNN